MSFHYALPGGPARVSPWEAGRQQAGTAYAGLGSDAKILFDQSPNSGFEWLLGQYGGLAPGQAQSLRRLADLLKTRYEATTNADPFGTRQLRWIDWLTKQDLQREHTATPRDFRNETQSRFGGPVRVIPF